MSQFNPFLPNLNYGASVASQFYNPYQIQVPTTTDNDNNTNFGMPITQINSGLGTPVQSFVTFLGASYSSLNNPNTIITISEFTINIALISVSQHKNIVRTKVNGRNGTVKTYMGLDDYEINIEGTIIGNTIQQGVYPIDNVQLLQKICKAAISIKVNSPYLNNIFDIHYLCIKDFEINQEEGGYSQQKITLNCISDDQTDGLSDLNLTPYISI